MDGLQGSAGVNVAVAGGRGVQATSGLNVAGDWQGVQAAPLNVARKIDGLQLGLVNVGGDVKGVQLGLVNVARKVDGVSVGLVPYSQEGRTQAVAWYDTSGREAGQLVHPALQGMKL